MEGLGRSPGPSSTDPSNRSLATRASAQKVTEKSRDQLLNVNKTDSEVFTPADATKFLENGGYVAKGDPVTWSKLVTITLQLSQNSGKLPKMAKEGMRAVAILMDEVQTEEIANKVTERVAARLESIVEKIAEQAGDAKKATEALKEMAALGTTAFEDYKTEVQEITRQITEATQDLRTMERQRGERGEEVEGATARRQHMLQ
jgi:hypothetical protein